MKKLVLVRFFIFYLFLFPITLLCSSSLKSVKLYQHHVWTEEDGLPMNGVITLIQTPDGYLWLGTEMGAVRFNGINFDVFNQDNYPQFKNEFVFCLEIDSDGILWMGTRGGGLLNYKNGKFRNFSVVDGLLSNEIWSLLFARNGILWIGTRNGLNRYSDEEFTSIKIPDSISSVYIKELLEDRLGRIWVCTQGGGIMMIHQRADRFETEYIGYKGLKVTSMIESKTGDIWIGTKNRGLLKIKGDQHIFITKAEGLPYNHISCLLEDRWGNIWVGTYGGGIAVLLEKNLEIIVLNEPENLSCKAINYMIEDHEGTIWIGTDGGGLNSLRNTPIKTYTSKHGLSYDIVNGVFQDSLENIWIGTKGFGVNCWNWNTGEIKIYTTQEGLAINSAITFAENPEGTIWIGTLGGGINRVNLKNNYIENFNHSSGLIDTFVRSLYTDPQGVLWAGTDNGGVHRLKGGKFELYRNVNFRVNCMLLDNQKNLWVGTFGGGLFYLSEENTLKIGKEKGLLGKMVMCLYKDSKDLLFIGTYYHGLFCYKDGVFINISKKNGLPDQVIYCILEDRKNNLWMSSNRGVFCLSRKEVNQFFSGEINEFIPAVYGKNDGMLSSECNGGSQPAGYQTKDDKICFPTTHGLSVIDPENIGINSLPPQVNLEKIVINGNSYPVNQSNLVIPPGKGNLEIHYNGLSFFRSKPIKFKYKLEGWEEKWVDAGARQIAIYTNIPPGKYLFKVIASTSYKNWAKEGARISIDLKPKFFQSKTFYILLFLLSVLLLLFLIWISKTHLTIRVLSGKNKHSNLSTEEMKKYLRKILYLLEEEKIYRDPNISLKTFSGKLVLSTRTISQVINEELKKSFCELINEYRIKEASQILTNPKYHEKSILEISYEVGFNSKSTFNRVFKNITQLTPSQYRKMYSRLNL